MQIRVWRYEAEPRVSTFPALPPVSRDGISHS